MVERGSNRIPSNGLPPYKLAASPYSDVYFCLRLRFGDPSETQATVEMVMHPTDHALCRTVQKVLEKAVVVREVYRAGLLRSVCVWKVYFIRGSRKKKVTSL